MSKVIVVTSGKGGVGKTTSTASIGAALAHAGKRVCVVDFDVGLRNLDLVMGAERRVVFDFINVAHGDAKLAQALIRDKRIDTLHLLAASQTRDKDALTTEGVERVIGELRESFDYVLCDSPAGIERGEPVDKQLLITRFDPARSNSGEMLGIDDVLEILSIPLLGVIPESKEILRASNIGAPVTINAAAGQAGLAYLEAARRLAGEAVPV